MFKIPVVVVLGHIDHGKSSLLEAIKKEFRITKKESGGITQHMGAYEVETQGKKITFIDTPGHEAFSGMRARGASVADIAILVIAADDGVKPQTREAISAIKKAEIPMVVCLNKMDKPTADPQRVKSQLQKENVLVEDFGGDVPVVEVSAKTGKGINDLLEIINLLWEMSAEKERKKEDTATKGFVIESYLDSLRGPTATLILESGELKTGDIVGSSSTVGKIKTLEDFQGNPKKIVFPGEPAVITGIEEVPGLGEIFKKFNSIEEAQSHLEKKENLSFEAAPTKEGLNIILKTDARGTLEVIEKILKDLEKEGEKVNIIKGEVGEVNFSDIKLSEDLDAQIISFRSKVPLQVKNLAQQRNINILSFEIVYDLIDNVRKLVDQKKKKAEKKREEAGRVKITDCFKTQSKKGKYQQIIGGQVIDGVIKKGEVEIERQEKIIGKGRVLEIQKERKKIEKGDVGQQIGISYEGNVKVKEGDILITYQYVVS